MITWYHFLIVDPNYVSGACALLMLICLRVGFRKHRRSSEAQGHGNSLIDEACLAIMGLLLAFSFAAAYGKLDNRNAKISDDANAIRMLYFRCQALPDSYRKQIEPLIIDAVRERLYFVNADLDPAKAMKMDAQGRDTEMRMLAMIREFAQDKQVSDLVPSLIDACYDVVASHESRVAAGLDHVPVAVIVLLIFVSCISAFLLGRSEAVGGRLRRRAVTLIMIVSAIVYVTLDIEQPLRGFIQSNQLPILRLAENLGVSR